MERHHPQCLNGKLSSCGRRNRRRSTRKGLLLLSISFPTLQFNLTFVYRMLQLMNILRYGEDVLLRRRMREPAILTVTVTVERGRSIWRSTVVDGLYADGPRESFEECRQTLLTCLRRLRSPNNSTKASMAVISAMLHVWPGNAKAINRLIS